MITGRDAVIELLLSDSCITDVVGDRISSVWAEQDLQVPYIVVTTLAKERFHHMGGPSGLVEARIDVDIVAKTRRDCDLLADAVRKCLDGYTGEVCIGEQESLFIQQCHLDGEEDDEERLDDAAEGPTLHLSIQSYIVIYSES